jgi:hypothetical protein
MNKEWLKWLKFIDVAFTEFVMNLSDTIAVHRDNEGEYCIFELVNHNEDFINDEREWTYRLATKAEYLLIKQLLWFQQHSKDLVKLYED